MTIMTLEQYESAVLLLNLLENIGISKAEKAHSAFVRYHGNDWTPCDHCGIPMSECACDADVHGRYYAEYDDEASFE